MRRSSINGLPVPPEMKTLVVGTTDDYMQWIRESDHEACLFLTDNAVLRQRTKPGKKSDELVWDLSNYAEVQSELRRYLSKNGVCLNGIACFDCESLELAASIAQAYALPYPTVQAVNNCRDKYVSKQIWRQYGLPTPRTRIVQTPEEAVDAQNDYGGRIVLKPNGGSGSELIFSCISRQDCRRNFTRIKHGLKKRSHHRLYTTYEKGRRRILAEEFIPGEEYSCDFIIKNNRVDIIRIARKIISTRKPFGTASAYLVPAQLPKGITRKAFNHLLIRSASVLGINRAICMIDFKVDGDQVVLLELTPRPGGDCIPFLLRRSFGLDILTLTLNFYRERSIEQYQRQFAGGFFYEDRVAKIKNYVALRLHAQEKGVLEDVDTRRLFKDPRVLEIHIIRKPGHRIVLPPDDYESWLLGHIVFEPEFTRDPADQCLDLFSQIKVTINPTHDIKPNRYHQAA